MEINQLFNEQFVGLSKILSFNQENLSDCIFLNRNENPFGMSPLALSYIKEQVALCNRYPKNRKCDLQNKIAEKAGVSPNQIVISNGSDKILLLIAQVFGNSQSEIIFPQHSFIGFNIISKLIGAKVKAIQNQGWQVDLPAILDAINLNTKIIFLANPNNPTGAWVNHSDLQDFMARVPENVIVVLDEAYYEYAQYTLGGDYPDTIELQKKHSNLLITRTFSKAYGLAGLRIGYGIVHPDVANVINIMDFPHSVTELAMDAAMLGMKDQAYIDRILEYNAREMLKITKHFAQRGLNFLSTPANFVLLNCGAKAAEVHKSLFNNKILVCLLSDYYGHGLNQWLRISVGKPEENSALLAQIDEIISAGVVV